MSKSKKPAPAATKAKAKKAGRPRIEFDLVAVEGLGQIGATAAEMACVLPASQSTIEHRMADRSSDFSKAYQKGLGLLKTSLRRKQVQVALSGNAVMLIWLGKQLLEQQDKRKITASPLEEAIRTAMDKAEKITDIEAARKRLQAARAGVAMDWDQ